MSVPASEQLRLLYAGAAEVVPEEELERKLERSVSEGRPLRVKLGIDPSAPDLHLGHAVVLRTLRRFQDFGHIAVLIVGDFTGLVGDPTGRSETRPMLSAQELEANAQTYLRQVGTVLDMERAEVRRNSEWLAPLTFADVARLASTITIARLIERDDFSERYRGGQPISLSEFLYPLMQGYDSVAIRSDVEMGGSDQLFNLLVGRDTQRAHDLDPQVAFTMPLLPGTDADRKMSKSFGNHVGLTDPPEEQFGKTMSIPDELIVTWLRLCTDLDTSEVDAIESGLGDASRSPNEEKRRLAREIVRLYHGEEAAKAAEERFDMVHKRQEIPENVPEIAIPPDSVREGRVWLPRLMTEAGLASSNADARRLIEGGGVRLDGEPLSNPDDDLPADGLRGRVLQVGKRRFVRIT
ncbi:MAG: tyrosine--tRNA ligase [Actinomycetota bacterium]|nr:tyrosine--tRNA ligase [Actinomycetota bacterium]